MTTITVAQANEQGAFQYLKIGEWFGYNASTWVKTSQTTALAVVEQSIGDIGPDVVVQPYVQVDIKVA